MNSRPPDRSNRRAYGVTLIELMVTVSVLVVLLALGVPSFQLMIASSRVSTVTNDLLTTLAQARSNAIQSGARVTVCKSANGTQCTTSGDWDQGWIMFNDNDRSATDAVVNSGETITFSAPAVSGGIVIRGNLNYVSFAADGQPKSMNGSGYFGTLRICSTASALSNDKRARDLIINRTGRTLVERKTGIASTCPSP